MQSKRYSWHPCVHCHGYLVHLQQNGLVHDLTPQLQEHIPPCPLLLNLSGCSCSFGKSQCKQQWGTQHKLSQNLQHIFSLYSVSKCVFWQAQSLKNSRQFFQQAVINITPAHLTCCIFFEGAVFT